MNNTLEQYHQQRDALIGRKADHLKPPTTYTRGAIPLPDKRQGHRGSFALRVVLTVVFFALWIFVFMFGLMDWRVK
jgi:hypothetical protein